MATESRLQARIDFLEAVLHNNGFCKDGAKCTLSCSQNQTCGRILAGKEPMLAQSVGLFPDWTLYDPERLASSLNVLRKEMTHYDRELENQFEYKDGLLRLYMHDGDAPSSREHIWVPIGKLPPNPEWLDVNLARSYLPKNMAAAKKP